MEGLPTITINRKVNEHKYFGLESTIFFARDVKFVNSTFGYKTTRIKPFLAECLLAQIFFSPNKIFFNNSVAIGASEMDIIEGEGWRL